MLATVVLVEALLRRRADGDLQQAQAAIDRLADVPTEPGMVMFERGCLAGCGRWSRGHKVTRPSIESLPTATARWRHRWATRGT